MLDCIAKNTSLMAAETIPVLVHMSSHHADTLKYGFTDAFGYNKCKLVSTLGAALMENGTKGEKTV